MSEPLQIEPCSRTPRGIGRFLNVPYPTYKDDPHWVAPLLVDVKLVFSEANPLFQPAEIQMWIAHRNDRGVAESPAYLIAITKRRMGTAAGSSVLVTQQIERLLPGNFAQSRIMQ